MTNALRSPKSLRLYDLASTAFRWKSTAGLPSASPTEPSVVEDDIVDVKMEGLRKLSRVPQNKHKCSVTCHGEKPVCRRIRIQLSGMEGKLLPYRSEERRLPRILLPEAEQRGDQQILLCP